MIIGNYSLDPRRILTANYSIANKNIYNFKIGYVIGSQLIEIIQLGKEKECKEWLSITDSVIGKGPLIDAISNKELDNEEEDFDTMQRKKIGFAT